MEAAVAQARAGDINAVVLSDAIEGEAYEVAAIAREVADQESSPRQAGCHPFWRRDDRDRLGDGRGEIEGLEDNAGAFADGQTMARL